jgi:hypothetical protein
MTDLKADLSEYIPQSALEAEILILHHAHIEIADMPDENAHCALMLLHEKLEEMHQSLSRATLYQPSIASVGAR